MKTLPQLNILITGAGGPAAICALKSLQRHNLNIHMADMSGFSAGLYMVPEPNRHVILPGKHKDFVKCVFSICQSQDINILIPTVDCELPVLAKEKETFESIGTQVLSSDCDTLKMILDKYHLLSTVSKETSVGQFEMLYQSKAGDWTNKKIVVKPIQGSGSRGVNIYNSFAEIPKEHFADTSLMIQEFFDGPEYSVDVMVTKHGDIKAIAPRVRMRTDSGVSVTGKIDINPSVISYAKEVIHATGLTYMANIQIIDSPTAGPKLVEINPRFSGGLSLVIEAGADTPLMCIQDMIGMETSEVDQLSEIAMVRSYTENFLPAAELKVT